MFARRALAIFAIASLAATPAAAAGPKKGKDAEKTAPTSIKQEKRFPLDATWVAIKLDGKPLNSPRPTVIIDQQLRARGFGGCNTFSATAYPLAQQHFAVGPFAVTKKACDKDVMAVEHKFLVTFHAAQSWDLVEGGHLVLKGALGEIVFDRGI